MRTRKFLKSSLRKTTETRRRRRTGAARALACCKAIERRRTRRVFQSSQAAKELAKNCKVSEKLDALKNLIPRSHFNNGRGCEEDVDDGQIVKTERLFQETADYIILLRTRVVVLQRLIEFYGYANTSQENQNDSSVNVLV